MNLGNLIHRFVAPIVALGVVGVLLVMAPQPASAQGVTVAIPFSFSVDNQQYPAGTYRLILDSQWLLSIRNTDGGSENYFPMSPEDSGPSGSHSRLIFYNCEGHRRLQAVYIPSAEIAAELIGPDNATKDIKTHRPRPSVNCLTEKSAVQWRSR